MSEGEKQTFSRREWLAKAAATSIFASTAGCLSSDDNTDKTNQTTNSTSASVTTDTTAPNISTFQLSNPEGQRIQIQLQANEKLTNIQVTLNGPEATILDTADFERTNRDGTYRYQTTYQAKSDGTYSARLEVAEDDQGNDGATEQTARVAIDNKTAGISNLELTNPTEATLTVRFETTEQLTSVNAVVDGPETHTLAMTDFSISASDDGYLYKTTLDQIKHGSYEVKLTNAADADGNELTTGQTARVTTDTTVPTISTFSISNPKSQTVEIMLQASERLTTIEVALTGAETTTLTTDAFTESTTGSAYMYTATYEGSSDGTYTATLVAASGTAGNDAATDQRASATIDTTPATISSFTLTNPTGSVLKLSLTVSERLDTLEVALTQADTQTLSLAAFEITQTSNGYQYTTQQQVAAGGTYTATVTAAVDAAGNDAATGQSRDVVLETSQEDTALSFEDGTVGSSSLPDPLHVIERAGTAEITDNASDGQKALHLDSNDSSDPVTVAVDVDFTDVHQIIGDMYPVSVTPNAGYMKLTVDQDQLPAGHLHTRDHPGRTEHAGEHTEGFRDGEWHRDIEFYKDTYTGKQVSEITGEHQLIFYASGVNNVIWDNLRFKDADDGFLPLSDVLIDTSSGSGGDEFESDFEDGNFDSWEPIELPERSSDHDGNDWSVVENPAINGDHSLRLKSNGDRDDNTVATKDRVVDMSRDFDLEFTWMTPHVENRGPSMRLLDEDGTQFSDRENGSVYPDRQLTVGTGTGEITNGNKGGQFCGESWDHPSFETDTEYTFRMEKRGDTATLFLDDEQQMEETVRTSGQYRLTLSASGTWGDPATNYFDDIYIRPV